jgi:hypothetical protein
LEDNAMKGDPTKQPRATKQSRLDPKDIKIHPDFVKLIPPLSPGEYASLEQLILHQGCRDPLVVWKEHGILLDGHNRREICTRHNLPFKIVEIEVESEEAARLYIVQNQLSRRNITPEASSYLRGKRYEAEKGEHGGSRRTKGPKDQSDPLTTAERLGQEYKVGQATIKRDFRFAQAVDRIVANCGEESKNLVLSRDTGLSRGAVARLARMKPAEQQETLRQLKETGKLPRKQRRKGKRMTITLPTKPKEFAATLVEKLSRQEVEELAKALAAAMDVKKGKEGEAGR